MWVLQPLSDKWLKQCTGIEVLCFGAGRFGQGRDHHAVDKDRSQLPAKHPGAYLSVYFVQFICWELKRIAPKRITQEETSSFADNPPGFCWVSAVSRLALCGQACRASGLSQCLWRHQRLLP